MRYGRRTCAAAAVVAAIGLAAGCADTDDGSSGDDSSSSSSGGALDLPDELGELSLFETQCGSLGDSESQCLDSAANLRTVTQASVANLSQAYGDAEAAGEVYATTDLEQMVKVLAVAGPSPGLWTTDSEAQADYARLGHPQEWVEEQDGAQCLVHTTRTVPEGETMDPDDVVTVRCQATDDDLTVVLLPAPDTSVDDALALTREAFEAVG